ncbi:MAG TPA: DUF2461 domain-containing protein, partial [Bryobacteraceae bacterium]|nr:DUF2461 domain-containing protein [Bryobacteraceae bacterium]
MASSFQGFPKEGLAFFRGLKKNNNREWFQARKAVYDSQVRAPMADLITALNAELAGFAPAYVTDPARAIYRIYRDTRFSPDKTPYKTHIAALFMPRGLVRHASGSLYFSVSPDVAEIAGGIYMPGPDELLTVRTHLAANHERLRGILRDRKLKSLLGDLCGDKLARVPRGFSSDHPAADLLRMKQWYVFAELDPALAATTKLYGEVLKRFRAMIPLVEFLNEPLRA